MRIAHITDIHVQRRFGVSELFNKRLLGAMNLYLFGRAAHFSEQSQLAMVRAVVAAEPDLVLCTGDLTATATETEFIAAKQLLAPLIERFPFLCIPGNHDVYTSESVGRYAGYFGDDAAIRVSRHGAVEVVAVDVCHPDWLSRGKLASEGLVALDSALAQGETPVLVMVHYPLRNRSGERYGPATRALSDAAEFEAVLAKHPRVRWLVHGHEHHGYRTQIPTNNVPIDSINPGAAGYAWLPEQGRTAHFCVYEFADAELLGIERFRFDGREFVPEPGGAFASGG